MQDLDVNAGLLFEGWDYLGLREGIQKPFVASHTDGNGLGLNESGHRHKKNGDEDERARPDQRRSRHEMES
jgi:hypothetical protein